MLESVRPSDILCDTLKPYVDGYLPEEFCGRRVIQFRQTPGVFGSTSVKKPKLRKYTLVNGIINQCEIHSDGRPGSYWAVLDAMSELRNFNKEEAIQYAVNTLVDYNGRFRTNAHKSCLSAFYILKTHIRHPARKTMGFGFIIDQNDNGSDKEYFIRARHLHETSAEEEKQEELLATFVVGK